MFRGVVEDARRVGRFGPHFSGPSAEATLQGCSRRFIPRIRQSTALRTGRPTIRPRSTRRCDGVVVLGSDRCLDARRSGRRGGQRRYSDLAIETAMTLRLIYHLPLRQAHTRAFNVGLLGAPLRPDNAPRADE